MGMRNANKLSTQRCILTGLEMCLAEHHPSGVEVQLHSERPSDEIVQRHRHRSGGFRYGISLIGVVDSRTLPRSEPGRGGVQVLRGNCRVTLSTMSAGRRRSTSLFLVVISYR